MKNYEDKHYVINFVFKVLVDTEQLIVLDSESRLMAFYKPCCTYVYFDIFEDRNTCVGKKDTFEWLLAFKPLVMSVEDWWHPSHPQG